MALQRGVHKRLLRSGDGRIGARDDEEREPDRKEILEHGERKSREPKRPRDPHPVGVAAERSRNRAKNSRHNSERDAAPMTDQNRRAAKRSDDEARDEAGRRRSGGRFRKLVADELPDGGEREEDRRHRMGEEGETGASKRKPTHPRAPTHRRRGGHRAQSRREADQKGEDERHAESTCP